jgi:hypothetical protein
MYFIFFILPQHGLWLVLPQHGLWLVLLILFYFDSFYANKLLGVSFAIFREAYFCQ